MLQTNDGEFLLFKTDILTRTLTYSSDKRMGANLTVIPASRAFEIIALNKQGIRPDKLALDDGEAEERREYIDLTDQDALTRFDKAKKKKGKHKQANQAAQQQKPAQKKEQTEPQKEDQPQDNTSRKTGNQRRHKRKQNNNKNSNPQTHDPKDA